MHASMKPMDIVVERFYVVRGNLDMSAIPYCVQTVRERCHVIHVMVMPILDLPLLLPIKPAGHWNTMDKVRFHHLNQQVYIA
jgi:hypothetical protein